MAAFLQGGKPESLRSEAQSPSATLPPAPVKRCCQPAHGGETLRKEVGVQPGVQQAFLETGRTQSPDCREQKEILKKIAKRIFGNGHDAKIPSSRKCPKNKSD